MRTFLIGALAATLAGCSSRPLPPQAGMKSCTDTNGFACFDRAAARQPLEPKPVSFKTNSAPPEIKPAIAAKTEKPSFAHARDKVQKTEKPNMVAVKGEPSASRIPLPPRSLKTRLQPVTSAASDTTRANITDSRATDSAVANSTTERMTVATMASAPEPQTNDRDRPNHSETVLRGDAEKVAPVSPNNTDLLVALLMARSEIKSVSDLTGKIIAIDGSHSASNGKVRTAIVAAGASEVLLFGSRSKAVDLLISGEVPAAVLALVSPEAAEGFPEIAGFKIFRIPLSPR